MVIRFGKKETQKIGFTFLGFPGSAELFWNQNSNEGKNYPPDNVGACQSGNKSFP